jgi:GNAT superfamily N-acetyltransferase
MTNVKIERYKPEEENRLFALIEREGEEWKDYWSAEGKPKYQKAIAGSIVYLIFENDNLCGYARCRDDDGFGIYVYDLLVDEKYRGKEYGRLLMEKVCSDFPNDTVYVMGDVYPYYEKLGYDEEGKIYTVKIKR